MSEEKKLINPDPFCEVRMQQIENRGRKTDKFMIEMMDPDTKAFVEVPGLGTVHSADYKLVTNKQVHDMALQVMSGTKLQFEPIPSWGAGHSVPLYWNGKSYSEKWFCKDTGVKVPGGSSMMMGLEITNSYDGSAKVGLAFFAMHVACSNQFYGGNLMGCPFEFPHVNRGGNLDDDIGEAMNQIQVQASTFGKIAPNMKRLAEMHIGQFSNFLAFRKQLREETKVEFRDKQILDELSGFGITNELGMKEVKYNDPGSYWDIANAYTAVATHAVGGPRGADQSGRVVDWILRRAGCTITAA